MWTTVISGLHSVSRWKRVSGGELPMRRNRKKEPSGLGTRVSRRGFTLMELLIVIGITALLLLVLFLPLTKSLELSSRGQARIRGLDSVRHAMRRVTRDLSQAMAVYPPADI